ncbi:MAG: hypothetical protein HY929_03615 [Euryarchaeota archaeon]|nr:hypothetical protein [Euryarchaeota archaeon]
MTGPAKSKIRLENAVVYIHKEDPLTGSKVIHIDIEQKDLNEIIEPNESTFCAGKSGGVFLGLKKEMQKRAQELIKKLEKS